MVKSLTAILISIALLIGAAIFEWRFVDKQFESFEEELFSTRCCAFHSSTAEREKQLSEIVEILIDYISVGKRIPGTRNVPIEIHWNF